MVGTDYDPRPVGRQQQGSRVTLIFIDAPVLGNVHSAVDVTVGA
ncbi:MAG: hypothetical protein ACTHJJ_01885 [Intrasporangium sp.]